jgi:hypothetical protein
MKVGALHWFASDLRGRDNRAPAADADAVERRRAGRA